MPALSDYIIQTRRLLHDASGQYFSDTELTDYINTARTRVVSDTGCNRVLQIVNTIIGQETYSYGGVTSFTLVTAGSGYATPGTYALGLTGGGGSGAAGTYTVAGGVVTAIALTAQGVGYTSAPTLSFPSGGGTLAAGTALIMMPGTLDVLNVTVRWGSMRIPLNYMAFTQFNRDIRGLQQFVNRPGVFSKYGQNTVYLGPTPDQVYVTEWDTVVVPAALVNPTDADVIAVPYSDPIPFYAAYLAKFKEAEMTEADRFRAEYVRQAKEAIGAVSTRRILNQYTAG